MPHTHPAPGLSRKGPRKNEISPALRVQGPGGEGPAAARGPRGGGLTGPRGRRTTQKGAQARPP
eukprot:12752067-Alexandrium_andersonii.AAC.1